MAHYREDNSAYVLERLDPFDRRILIALLEDGRISNVDLATRVGLSASPCWTRMKKLERDGIIAGYRAIISPEALGYQQVMLIDVALENHSEGALKSFEEAIRDTEEVAAIDVLAGSFDFQLRIHSQDTADYERFLVSKLYRIPNIKTIRSNLVLRSIQTKSIF